jgi:CheY-like chemotaxis protein
VAPARSSQACEDNSHHPEDVRHIRGSSVLVLEDEPLVAMMTCRVIEQLGASIVGPFGRLEEAREVSLDSLDAAVLDVNVNGELVYEFATEIKSRGKPILFVTGYHAGAIEKEFSDVPVLTKPIEPDTLAAMLAEGLIKRRLKNTSCLRNDS